jgi:hypothetical protein
LFGTANNLAVAVTDPVSMSVTVDTGEFFIEGYWAENTASLTLTHDASHATLNRIDRIIGEVNVTTRAMTIKILKGTDAASPTAPALTRTASIYQISLAQVYVGATVVTITADKVTDERDDTDVCGRAQRTGTQLIHSETLPVLNGDFTSNYADVAGVGRGVIGIDDAIYVFGSTTGPSVKCSKWTLAGGWEALADLPNAVGNPYLVYDGDNLIYAVGGSGGDTDACTAYSISANTHASKANVTSGAERIAAYVDGKIYAWAYGGTGMFIYTVSANTCAAGASAAQNVVNISTDGTNIYLNRSAAVDFYRYNVASDNYNSMAVSPSANTGSSYAHHFYYDGFIYSVADANSGNSFFMYAYSIEDNVWYTLVTAGATRMGDTSSNSNLAILSDLRIINPMNTGSKVFTYFYMVDTADTAGIYNFRLKTDSKIKLANITAFSAGDSIALEADDIWGLFINDTSLTTTGYKVEVYKS